MRGGRPFGRRHDRTTTVARGPFDRLRTEQGKLGTMKLKLSAIAVLVLGAAACSDSPEDELLVGPRARTSAQLVQFDSCGELHTRLKDNLKEEMRVQLVQYLEYYGGRSAQWLSDLTHLEDPWREARAGLADGARSTVEISLESMARYYESLGPDTE